MQTFLYSLWFLFPILILLFALYSKLESIGTKKSRPDIKDLTNQGIFCLVCSFIALLIDQNILEGLKDSFLPDFIPLELMQVLLYPVVLYVVGLIWGGSY